MFTENEKQLIAAVENNKLAVIQDLFKQDKTLSPDLKNENGATLLMVTLNNMHYDPKAYSKIANFLLNQNANPKLTDAKGLTALHYAVQNPKASTIVKRLINAGADANAADEKGKTVLHHAVRKERDLSVIAMLVEAGANINAVTKQKKTPLMKAIVSDEDLLLVKELVKTHKADINKSDDCQSTALHKAAEKGCTKIIEFLMNCKANMNALNDEGETPLFILVSEDRIEDRFEKLDIEITLKMIKAGARLDHQNKFGNSLLHLAVMRGRYMMVEALMDAGAPYDLVNHNGATPLEMAKDMAEEDRFCVGDHSDDSVDNDDDNSNTTDDSDANPAAKIVVLLEKKIQERVAKEEALKKDNTVNPSQETRANQSLKPSGPAIMPYFMLSSSANNSNNNNTAPVVTGAPVTNDAQPLRRSIRLQKQ